MNFIIKFSKSKKSMTKISYDSVLIITDKLTKYCYFLPYMKKSTAKNLAYTFLKIIENQHGLSEEIISDRDKLFTSKFWKAFIERLGVNHKLSTAYHPQTDGQTERMNQTLEQYFKHYVNYKQIN